MSDQHSPIGILDSGIGGFSVVRQVQRLLPREELLYFGDGDHIPYGNHTRQAIVEMARYMFRFMEARGVKALLVACNTISCVLDSCGGEVSCPVFSAVQAGAEAAARLEADKVGVISTVFTHNSRVYPRSIQALSPRKLVVLSCGCPDLARLVEHSLGDPAGMAQVPLIDPAEEMARSLQAYLIREGLGNPQSAPGTLSVYTTGDVEEYALRARQVGLERVSNVEYYPPMEL